MSLSYRLARFSRAQAPANDLYPNVDVCGGGSIVDFHINAKGASSGIEIS